MLKASLLVWAFVGLAGLSIVGLVILTIVDIRAERRQRRLAMAEPDLAIDTHLSQLEQELSSLKEHFQSDYPGGPLVVGDGQERQVFPPDR